MVYFIVFFIITIIFISVAVNSSLKKDKEDEKKYRTISTVGKETLVFDLTGVHISKWFIMNFCKEGDVVTLEFEPDNKYDPNAIKVLHGTSEIGYVPSFETDEVKEFMSKYDYYALIYKKEMIDLFLIVEIGLVQK